MFVKRGKFASSCFNVDTATGSFFHINKGRKKIVKNKEWIDI